MALNVVDTMQLHETMGFWATVAIIAILIIIYIVYRVTCKRLSTAEKFIFKLSETIAVVKESFVTETGKVVSQAVQQETLNHLVIMLTTIRDEFNESYSKHIADVERLASEDKYKDCDIAKCIHLSKIIWAVEQVSERLEAIEKQTHEARNDAVNSMEQTRSQVTAISKDLLATLRVFASGGQK
ncbi:MAG: hypothetical protein ACP5VS_01510 [Desulfomonilaceae bacterium]